MGVTTTAPMRAWPLSCRTVQTAPSVLECSTPRVVSIDISGEWRLGGTKSVIEAREYGLTACMNGGGELVELPETATDNCSGIKFPLAHLARAALGPHPAVNISAATAAAATAKYLTWLPSPRRLRCPLCCWHCWRCCYACCMCATMAPAAMTHPGIQGGCDGAAR